MKKKNEDSYAKLTETEQDFEELERQSKEAANKLLRARNDVRQLEEEIKTFESSKIKLDDQCKQLARVSLTIFMIYSYLLSFKEVYFFSSF